MGLGGSTVRMHHARKMKNLIYYIYSASVTHQPDRRKGVNLDKKKKKVWKYHFPMFINLRYFDRQVNLGQ